MASHNPNDWEVKTGAAWGKLTARPAVLVSSGVSGRPCLRKYSEGWSRKTHDVNPGLHMHVCDHMHASTHIDTDQKKVIIKQGERQNEKMLKRPPGKQLRSTRLALLRGTRPYCSTQWEPKDSRRSWDNHFYLNHCSEK